MKTILVVEDNADQRILAAEMLKMRGYNVLEAENGEVGLEQIKLHDVDLVFTDLIMPGRINSVDMVQAALVELCKNDLKVLYTSGYPDVDRTLVGEGAPIIAKPYRMDDVINKIAEMLS